MSTRLERMRVFHEREKRRLEQKFDADVRDILGDEGFTNFMIGMIVAAALFAIALIVTPEPVTTAIGGALAAGLIIVVAAVMLSWGVGRLSTDQVNDATERYGRDEESEDNRYLDRIEQFG
ncbi:hypothetical protein [Qipengyuania mesophila]|uniref:hypothetical protein n=1 Tax=Qipengyuania mesophila TaxID=2867246 RepID=UPI0035167D38